VVDVKGLQPGAGAVVMVPAGVGILGLSVGFFFVLTPMISAAARALPPEQAGAGLGILQGAQFLGAGAGPAVLGVLVTARQQAGADALNPLHAGDAAAAYSDAFLAMAAIAVLAVIVALRMRPGRGGAGRTDRAQ
jgi:hypothetical protein